MYLGVSKMQIKENKSNKKLIIIIVSAILAVGLIIWAILWITNKVPVTLAQAIIWSILNVTIQILCFQKRRIW